MVRGIEHGQGGEAFFQGGYSIVLSFDRRNEVENRRSHSAVPAVFDALGMKEKGKQGLERACVHLGHCVCGIL